MRRLLVTFALWGVLLTTGCTSLMDLNPFSRPAPTNPGDAAYCQFAGILVPTAMRPLPARSLVSTAPDGNKNGVEIFEGPVKLDELATVMARYMERESWRLITAQQGGGREVQVYDQQSLHAVLHFYTQASQTVLEVWVGSATPGGQYPFATATPMMTTTPTASTAPGAAVSPKGGSSGSDDAQPFVPGENSGNTGVNGGYMGRVPPVSSGATAPATKPAGAPTGVKERALP